MGNGYSAMEVILPGCKDAWGMIVNTAKQNDTQSRKKALGFHQVYPHLAPSTNMH